MSKMYEKYLKEKENNGDLYYLFECGKFYIFLDEDARKISNITTLKLTRLNDDIVKCGFPINSLDKYMNIFNNLNLYVKIIEKEKDFDINKLIKKVKCVDIDNITPFEMDLETNIVNIINELKDGKYRLGKYRTFTIYEPKERIIKALPFKDRIVQQWYIEEFIKPYIVPRLINTTCACIEKRGNLYAVNLCQKYMRIMKKKYNNYYVLKCDIKKYFYSIDKNILYNIMKKYITDKRLLKLSYIFIFEDNNSVGIPIGNLSSQWFANIYLNELDIYIKEILKVKYYIRYMDDLVIMCESKEKCKNIKEKISDYINNNLNLEFNGKTNYYPKYKGVNFCGYKIYEDYKLIRDRSKKKINKNIRKWYKLKKENRLNKKKMLMSYKSWIAYAKHGDTYRYRLKILKKIAML